MTAAHASASHRLTCEWHYRSSAAVVENVGERTRETQIALRSDDGAG